MFDKIKEETRRVRGGLAVAADKARMTDELGDIIFALVNVARFLGISAEDALQGTISKFLSRFSRTSRKKSPGGAE